MNLKNKPQQRVAWVQLGYMALSFVLSYIAGRLLAKKTGLKVDDDKPTTLTTRGSYCNFVIGRRRVGPAFCWAGEREIKKEKTKGGKGGASAPDTDIYYEAGWHILCSNGPVTALHQIIQGGKIIFDGPITSDSHPSGSTIDLGKEGAFTIYWGEENQPINTYLGDAGRVGVSSRWPFFCYIVWNKKRLSSSPQWQVLDYVIDRRLEGGHLSGSTGYYEPSRTLTGPTGTIIGHTNGAEGVGKFEFAGDYTQEFQNGSQVALLGNSMADGDYDVLRSETVIVVTGTHPITGAPIYATHTYVFLYGGVTGANNSGTMQEYEDGDDDGLNPAHIVAEIQFNQWPQGLGLDPADENEPWDLDSLEEVGIDTEDDLIRSSYVGVNGEKASSALAAFMQDYGFLMPLDTSTGSIKYQLVREPTGTLPNIAASAVVGSLPEIETNHAEMAVDRLIFKFTDRLHSFGDMTISIDNDGQASYEENQRSRVVEVPTVINFNSASTVAERRSQEELAGAATLTIQGARGARTLIPGQAITVENVDEILRITGIKFDPLSSAVELKAMIDYYGAKKSDFVNNQSGGETNFLSVAPDEIYEIVEVPEYLLAGDPMTILLPRIRAHAQIIGADLWISRDNTTYTLAGQELNVQTGGTLDTALAADGDHYLPQGPTITALGPDIGTVLDLSGDDTNWLLGRQLVVISSDAGIEICFLQNVTAMGGDTYRLDGLVRARYDTVRLAHGSGAKVFIFENTAIESIQDILLIPGEDLYAKTQPNASSGQLALSAVAPQATVLHGKGVVPMDATGLHVTAPQPNVSAYATTNDISLKWGYRSTVLDKTGAGMQGAGAATVTSPLEGNFTIEFLTTGNVLKKTVAQTGNTYTYTNATLVTDFGSEPAAFKVRITRNDGGYSSDYIELTITKV